MKKVMFSLGSLASLVMPLVVSAQWSITATPSAGLPRGAISAIILGIMNWLLILIGIIGVIGFVISGILYLTAAGNEDRMQKGKNAMTWSIIGVIVGLVGFVVIQAVDKMLNATPNF
ncbi:MAG: hypothetical protein ACWGHO_03365 [Candidatus Moraniibacteriota bacterium]